MSVFSNYAQILGSVFVIAPQQESVLT